MSFVRELGFFRDLTKVNLKASTALKGAFTMQMIFMILNNLTFFAVWIIFFKNFRDIRGWTLPDMMNLMGFVAGAFGFSVVFFGGALRFSKMIFDGQLDVYLVQPKETLSFVVGSRSEASGWGDILTSILLFIWSDAFTDFKTFSVIVLIFFSGCLVFVATNILVHSVAFWISGFDEVARQIVEYLIVLSTYPQHIFQGFMKVLVFWILPAALLGYFPVTYLREPRAGLLFEILLASLAYISISLFIFKRGMRKYESGNRFL